MHACRQTLSLSIQFTCAVRSPTTTITISHIVASCFSINKMVNLAGMILLKKGNDNGGGRQCEGKYFILLLLYRMATALLVAGPIYPDFE